MIDCPGVSDNWKRNLNPNHATYMKDVCSYGPNVESINTEIENTT